MIGCGYGAADKFDKDAMVGTTQLTGYVYNLGSEIEEVG